MDISPVNEEQKLWVIFLQASNALHKVRERELAKYDLSLRQSAVLYLAIVTGGNVNASQIARWHVQEPHSVSELVKRMEKRGLVKRVNGSRGSRDMKIVPTEKGIAAWARGKEHASLAKIFSNLSQEEKIILELLLKRIRDTALKGVPLRGKLYLSMF